MKETLFIILGSILALITSFIIEIWNKRTDEKNLRKNFKTVLRLELKHSLVIIEKLNENFNNIKFFSFSTIDQLDTNLKRLENIRKDTVYLKEENKKDEILSCLNELSVFSSDIRGIENYAFNKIENEGEPDKVIRLEYCERQRQINILKTIDLKRKIQDIINFSEK